VIDSFFAHHFDSEESQYGGTLLMTLLVIGLNWIKDKMYVKRGQETA
jgi:hypothetical protein